MICLYPLQTEKAFVTSQSKNCFVFLVPRQMNKDQIAKEISDVYKVEVTNVRTLVQNGKKSRSVRIKQRGRWVYGQRSDFKKAYVTLAEGNQIPVFAQIEEANQGKEK